MKIYGIFRGFPGLGRVVSGLTLINTLEKDFGADVKVFTYMQGLTALHMYNYRNSIDIPVSQQDITSLGLDPVCKVSSEIINDIMNWKPDIVLVDGEPLLINLLCLCYDKNKIITLLNPSDLTNKALPYSTSVFFKNAFLNAGCAIVHGINCGSIDDFIDKSCKVYHINTILRREIIEMNTNNLDKKNISCVLGGGSKSLSKKFIDETIIMGKNIIEVAPKNNEYRFNIFCNDEVVYNALTDYNIQSNVIIFKEIAEAKTIYEDASLIICRAGRNTTSEVLYLNIPNILIAAGNDYRASEQKSNIHNIIKAYPNGTTEFNNVDYNVLDSKIKEMLTIHKVDNGFIPGNQKAIDIILNQYNTNLKSMI